MARLDLYIANNGYMFLDACTGLKSRFVGGLVAPPVSQPSVGRSVAVSLEHATYGSWPYFNIMTKFLTVRLIAGHLPKRKTSLDLCHFESAGWIFAIFTPNDLSFKIIFINKVKNQI